MESRDQELFEKLFSPHNRRDFIKRAGALGLSASALTAFLEACGSSTSTGSSSTPTVNMAGPIDMQTLMTNAKKEGQLQAIGIPPEWADYKDILAGYTSNYGIPVSYKVEAEYSSAQELGVFKNSIQHPHGDIGDVGFKFGPQAVQQGLVTPYIHAKWADIPASLKDPNGNWCTEYYGAQALIVNTDIVKTPPTSFQDLLNNSYKNMVGIDGDPRQANDAFLAVFTASLANGGNLDNIQPGIDFFAKLKQKGNFTVARSSDANIAKGEVATEPRIREPVEVIPLDVAAELHRVAAFVPRERVAELEDPLIVGDRRRRQRTGGGHAGDVDRPEFGVGGEIQVLRDVDGRICLIRPEGPIDGESGHVQQVVAEEMRFLGRRILRLRRNDVLEGRVFEDSRERGRVVRESHEG